MGLREVTMENLTLEEFLKRVDPVYRWWAEQAAQHPDTQGMVLLRNTSSPDVVQDVSLKPWIENSVEINLWPNALACWRRPEERLVQLSFEEVLNLASNYNQERLTIAFFDPDYLGAIVCKSANTAGCEIVLIKVDDENGSRLVASREREQANWSRPEFWPGVNEPCSYWRKD
jgi:hypothetical protein